MTDEIRDSMPSLRSQQAVRLGLLFLLLWVALATFFRADIGGPQRAVESAFVAEARAANEVGGSAMKRAHEPLPEVYRVIRPAGEGGYLPSIPPSETWPAP